MSNLNKVISTAKKLINLPYNKFNLKNYFPILYKNFTELGFKNTPPTLPIKLMSNQHINAGIVTCNNLISPYLKRKIYIVGKGVLFDSGGLDLKKGMADMSNDKAGALIALSVANYFKNNIVAICPITTNFVQTSQISPGDEIQIGQKIVKITNTDAEGRLILAEAISTLNASKNDIIITIATLTGSVAHAIGEEATGVFAENENLLKLYAEAAFEAKELAWGLPLWEHYQKQYYMKKIIKNSIQEIKAGATEGAMFIKQFIPYTNNWIHLDIAFSAFSKNGRANGIPIKSLVNFIKKIK